MEYIESHSQGHKHQYSFICYWRAVESQKNYGVDSKIYQKALQLTSQKYPRGVTLDSLFDHLPKPKYE